VTKHLVPDAAPPNPFPRAPRVLLPNGACDCHAHVFGPSSKYPYDPNRIYTPAHAPLPQYLELLTVLNISRAVLVQPSPYGADNRALLDAIKDRPNFRGVAVLPPHVSDRELEALNEAGVRGVRFNIVDTTENTGVFPADRIERFAERIGAFGWHIELLAHVNEYPNLDQVLGTLSVPVVFGHLGYVPTREGTRNAGFQALLRLMRDGQAWVKLTAPYRISASGEPFPDVTPFAHALLEAAPGRVVWGTDWPHIKAAWQIPMPNDGDLTDLLTDWIPDADLRRRVLVDNPTELYCFDK
jgi:2-pyrone-4,6-dicarboxylate lactonase